MTVERHHRCSRSWHWAAWLSGIGSLLWLLLRSGANPKRLAYPCQRAALASSAAFLSYLIALVGIGPLYLTLRRRTRLAGLALVATVLALTLLQGGGQLRRADATSLATLDLPAWTSATAVSDVFVAENVPAPQCSLASGSLPATPPCNDPAVAFADAGVDQIVDEMERRGTYFYATTAHPQGIVGHDDVVVIKVNDQWAAYGDGSGHGRLTTSTDVLKGLVWSILQHPGGFTGEIVVADNTQYSIANWDVTPANAEDQDQSFQDVVSAFQGQGYPVSLSIWDYLNDNLLTGGTVGGGYPPGEYVNGNDQDGYVLLEDPAGNGQDELSYPKFRTEAGTRVSMRYGVWNGSSYASDRLKLVNLPVLKRHGMAFATICWKNLVGFVTVGDETRRYGSWDDMHDFYWGYTGGPNRSYGLIGRLLAQVRAPDLNLVDAIWVGTQDNTSGPAVRANVLLASTDPFAADWYASEYVLRPVAEWDADESSAARAGRFRNATRVNQNAAKATWPGGAYPYVDLLDGYDGATPSNDEKNQMNVYLAGGVASCNLTCAASASGNATVGENVSFSGSATATGCTGTPAFTWDFGDGGSSTAEDPSHAYASAGTYTWSLTVTVDGQTCERSGSVEVGGGAEEYQLLVPAVIHAPGAAGTQWRTALAVLNPSAADTSLDLTLVHGEGSVTRSVTLPGRTSAEWTDVVVDLFERSAAASTSGAVHIAASGSVLVTSRTYNQTAQGTFGQYLPALSTASCLDQGTTGYLLQLKGTDDFRSNVGFANLAGGSTVARVTLFDDYGNAVGEALEVTVSAGEWRQVNDIFAATGAGSLGLAYATVEVTSGSSLWAYASVVDNHTGDATTIPVLRE